MSDDARTLPPAGFYPDPSGAPERRWWDGQRWTDRVEQAYTGNGIVQPELAPGAKTGTVWIWLIVLLPLLSLISYLLIDWRGYFQSSLDSSLSGTPTSPFAMYSDPAYVLLSVLGWVIYGITVVFAWLDWRALKRLGVVRPFHWAWAFLTSIVYVIGRSVVVRRRTHGGLAPLWVYIAVTVVGLIVSFAIIGVAIADVFNSPEFQRELRSAS